MSPFPVDPDARKRLQEAQRAEADALRAVEGALRARDRARERLDAHEDSLREKQRHLVGISGLDRAAVLMGAPVSAVRRDVVRTRRASPRSPADDGTGSTA